MLGTYWKEFELWEVVGCRLDLLLISFMTLSGFLNSCALVFSSVKWNYIYLTIKAISFSIQISSVNLHSYYNKVCQFQHKFWIAISNEGIDLNEGTCVMSVCLEEVNEIVVTFIELLKGNFLNLQF